ncbi:hypothetical protein BMS3Bbin01_00451 [bacterium BMS3Bbin01]|nr:hypothetical protein BMS3Bbin01_00451 [bacterium BMS3Bbin01]
MERVLPVRERSACDSEPHPSAITRAGAKAPRTIQAHGLFGGRLLRLRLPVQTIEQVLGHNIGDRNPPLVWVATEAQQVERIPPHDPKREAATLVVDHFH